VVGAAGAGARERIRKEATHAPLRVLGFSLLGMNAEPIAVTICESGPPLGLDASAASPELRDPYPDQPHRHEHERPGLGDSRDGMR